MKNEQLEHHHSMNKNLKFDHGQIGLDARYFTSTEVFNRVRDEVYFKTWQLACHVSQVEETGDYFSFSLFDQDGAPVDRSVFAGQWDLVFFGFTHCPDICPTTMALLGQARRQLSEDGQDPLPRVVLVSVDPERDTPEALGRYVAAFGDGNLGITGELSEIRRLTDGLGVYFEKIATDDESYTVDHWGGVIVIDPQGRFRALFTAPHSVDGFIHDVPLIMAMR